MQFKDIIGHKRLIEQLLRNIKEGRVSHALLFNGPDGAGKLPLALAFTQYLMCENKSDTDSCGTCPSCIKNQKLVHPDVHFSFPFLKVNDKSSCNDTVNLFRESVLENSFMSLNDWNNIIEAEKKQTLITVTESNEIIHKLNLKSFESPYKVSFIWNVDKLKPNASTKLLKIIEEPPANTFFILIANSIESLLPTLVSRTQIISVNQLSKTDISNALIEKRGASENKAKTISQLSNGNYRTAIELLEDEENEDYVESFLEWMRLCFKASSETDKLLDWVDQIAAMNRENQKAFINVVLEVLRECLLISVSGQNLLSIREEDKEKLVAFAKFIHENNAERIISELNKAYSHIERNAHPKILFLDLSMKIHQHLHTKREELAI